MGVYRFLIFLVPHIFKVDSSRHQWLISIFFHFKLLVVIFILLQFSYITIFLPVKDSALESLQEHITSECLDYFDYKLGTCKFHFDDLKFECFFILKEVEILLVQLWNDTLALCLVFSEFDLSILINIDKYNQSIRHRVKSKLNGVRMGVK